MTGGMISTFVVSVDGSSVGVSTVVVDGYDGGGSGISSTGPRTR